MRACSPVNAPTYQPISPVKRLKRKPRLIKRVVGRNLIDKAGKHEHTGKRTNERLLAVG
jgi:hypothetical protein